LENTSLTAICEYFGIKLDAHDALADVKAAREVIIRMQKLLKI
jgi:DNA polymerase III epsilon subunit-like protein